MKKFLRDTFLKYKHALYLLYAPVYMTAFNYLERIRPERIHMIDCPLDHMIPFVEVFIIPYILWFAFMLAAGLYFIFFEGESFVRMAWFGITGMSLFLLISWIYPNGLALRPEVFPRDNIFTDLVRLVYSKDTATNVLPSIHVFNSVAVACAIYYSEKLRRHPVIQKCSYVLTVLIILSTMFVKQHSVVDVISGLVLAYIMWELVYNKGVERLAAAYESFQESVRRERLRKKRIPRWQSK